MLTEQDLRKSAGLARREITHIEIDVLLTFLLQLFVERGLMEHLAFKGGTMLRKMVFGQQGRLSTDLDFTLRSELSLDDIIIQVREALQGEYRGIRFHVEDEDWYITDDKTGGGINPICSHDANEKGIKIKIQISGRERPILEVETRPQLELVYFTYLDFKPSDIPCLAFEEVVSEKLRAASQRAKIRDLYDLWRISKMAFNEEQVRSLAVLKLWQTNDGLDFDGLREQINDHEAYEVHDLQNLISKDDRPELEMMIGCVASRFHFLQRLTDLEGALTADKRRKLQAEAEQLRSLILERVQA